MRHDADFVPDIHFDESYEKRDEYREACMIDPPDLTQLFSSSCKKKHKSDDINAGIGSLNVTLLDELGTKMKSKRTA